MPNNTDSEHSNPALAVVEKPLMNMLGRYRNQITEILPKQFDATRMLKLIVGAINKDPKLLECTQLSVVNAVITAAAVGLEIRSGSAYLIPFKNKFGRLECQLVIDYRGKIDLARRSGQVSDVDLDIVYSKDKFRIYRNENGVKCVEHEPVLYKVNTAGEREPIEDQDRGLPIGALAVATFTAGGPPKVLFMPKCDVMKIKAKSKSKDSGPWVTDELEMWKKSASHRICKTLPQTPESAIADRVDDAEQSEVSFDIIDALPEDVDKPILETGSQAKADASAERTIAELKAKQAPAPAQQNPDPQPAASKQPNPTTAGQPEAGGTPEKPTTVFETSEWPKDPPQDRPFEWQGRIYRFYPDGDGGGFREIPKPEPPKSEPAPKRERPVFGRRPQQ